MSIISCPRCDARYDAGLYEVGAPVNCRCGANFYVPDLPNLARAWNCPNCGGSVNTQKNQCDYCGVSLSFARCAACLEVAPYRGAKFCSECGDSLAVPAKAVESSDKGYQCPRCGDQCLKHHKTGEYSVDTCDQCGGLWLDHHVLDQLIAKTRQEKNSHALLGKKASNQHALKRHKIRYLPCPECSNLMFRRNFAQRSGVIVDECSAHGIWFDKHELATILNFVRSSKDNIEAATLTKEAAKIQQPIKDEESPRQIYDISGNDLEQLFSEFPFFKRL